MSETDIILSLLFFVTAALYSSVGFGGGSSYLAILGVFLTQFSEIRTLALLCNILVVSSNLIIFKKEGILDIKSSFGFVILSIPMAFLGASIRLEEKTFFILLGFSLVLASLFMWAQIFIKKHKESIGTLISRKSFSLLSGGAAGLLSGMVGIGGGIFLSPYLNLTRWGTSKKIASVSSFFILVNSMAGLTGLVVSRQFSINLNLLIPLLIAVLLGSQAGLRISIKRLSIDRIKFLTALLIFYIGMKIVLLNIWNVRI